MSRVPTARRERGFTLLELAVSTLLLLLVLAIAHGLLVESARILRASGLRATAPDDRIAVRQLRRDLRAAAPLGLDAGWSSGPLDLVTERGTVRWERTGEILSRRRLAPGGADLGARAMLDRIVAFRWRTPVPGLVEAEIVRAIEAGSPELRASTVPWARSATTLETAHVVAASRRSGG